MRFLITSLLVCFISIALFAQVPQKITYQAIVRNSDKELVTNQPVGLEISILNGNSDVVFSESHIAETNANGLISLMIGEGQSNGNDLSMVDWALGPYFMEVNVDPSGGNDYTISGTSELVSVPYALFALKSAESKGDSDWVEDNVNDGIAVINETTGEYLFHANTSGNSFAKNSFSTGHLSAQTVSANIKNFKIDHPLDPQNKFLIHTSVESDERLNLYTGNVTTDETGYAKVQLPDWFDALNIDFRYQLTVIGKFAQAIVEKEIRNGVFTIRTNEPKTKVSWQVSGVRNDTWARQNPNVVEIPK